MAPTLSEEKNAGRTLPRPFYKRPWSGERQAAAQALWHWYEHLPRAVGKHLSTSNTAERCSRAAEQVVEGRAPSFVDRLVWQKVDTACTTHGLDRQLLAGQLKAASVFAGNARFADTEALNAYVQARPAAHVHLLAQLAEVDYSWQKDAIKNLARAFFITARLAYLAQDASANYIFIPQRQLKKAGVSEEQLTNGTLDQPLENILWRYMVSARDSYAQGVTILNDLSWSFRGSFKRAWLGGLEVLRIIENYNYDVWRHQVELSLWSRVQVIFQALAGRTTFKSR